MTIKFNLRSQPIQSKYLPTPIIDKDVSIKFVGEVIHLLVIKKIDIGSVKKIIGMLISCQNMEHFWQVKPDIVIHISICF